MAHPNMQIKEKIVDLPGTSLSVWKVHPDVLREQDKNARVMSSKTFQRLTENIKNSKQLESLPYCHRTVSPGGSEEFSIISGHHRVRAARKAGLKEIYVLVEDRELTKSQIIAKQLAHNSLAGTDDQQILLELYEAIDELNAKLESGIFNFEHDIKDLNVSVDELKISFDYEQVTILFLRHEYEDFSKILAEMEDLSDSREIMLCLLDQFDTYKEMIQAVSKKNNVRNIAAIMTTVLAIVKEYLAKETETPSQT